MNIYIFDFGNQIKIGQTGNVKQRLRNIETQSGREAVQHFSIKADGKYESLMHKVLSEYRGVGEYFAFPFEYAVSILKSLVKFEFAKDVKKGSQLFLPFVNKKVMPEKNIALSTSSLTVMEIADILHIAVDAAKRRMQRLAIKPVRYVGPTAIYDPAVLDILRNVPGKGRPKNPNKPP
jgi:hypothetical protein